VEQPDGGHPTDNRGVSEGPSPTHLAVDLAIVERECLKRGWTKIELAKRMGVHNDTVGRIYATGRVSRKTYGRLLETFAEHPALALSDELLGQPA
jgi:hypothetical protein